MHTYVTVHEYCSKFNPQCRNIPSVHQIVPKFHTSSVTNMQLDVIFFVYLQVNKVNHGKKKVDNCQDLHECEQYLR